MKASYLHYSISRIIKKYCLGVVVIFGLTLAMATSNYSFGAIEQNDRDTVPDELEKQLAEKFAPVLHRHPMDAQSGLADFNDITSGNSTLKAIELATGKYEYNSRTPPIHVTSLWHYDSQGTGSIPTYWILDIDDEVRHSGAPIGNRPLYYHVYAKDDGYYYIQYWYFFTMNDISSQTINHTWHEGDWEHVSIRVTYDGENYVPNAINFHQHYGGRTIKPEDAWWSSDYGTGYGVLAQGYRESYLPPCMCVFCLCKPRVVHLTHLNIWLGRNSHASYNRFDDLYILDSPPVVIILMGQEHFEEEVEYYNPENIFEYDKLVNMGEVYTSPVEDGYPTAHGYKWFQHYEQRSANYSYAIPGLAFTGDIGEYWASYANSIVPPGCPEAVTASPRSPFFPDMFHEWDTFTYNLVGFGNNNVSCWGKTISISWRKFIEAPQFQIAPKTAEFYDYSGNRGLIFDVTGAEGLYYTLEVTTDNSLFNNDKQAERNDSNFFSERFDSRAILSSFELGIPKDFVTTAANTGKLFYRLWVSIDKDGSRSWITINDNQWASAPFVTIIPGLDGDLNGDACVDSADLTVILDYLKGKIGYSSAYDVNNDNAVNIADARRIVTRFTNPRGAACK